MLFLLNLYYACLREKTTAYRSPVCQAGNLQSPQPRLCAPCLNAAARPQNKSAFVLSATVKFAPWIQHEKRDSGGVLIVRVKKPLLNTAKYMALTAFD